MFCFVSFGFDLPFALSYCFFSSPPPLRDVISPPRNAPNMTFRISTSIFSDRTHFSSFLRQGHTAGATVVVGAADAGGGAGACRVALAFPSSFQSIVVVPPAMPMIHDHVLVALHQRLSDHLLYGCVRRGLLLVFLCFRLRHGIPIPAFTPAPPPPPSLSPSSPTTPTTPSQTILKKLPQRYLPPSSLLSLLPSSINKYTRVCKTSNSPFILDASPRLIR